MGKQILTGTAFSYMRFSSPQQAAGDSIRRQTAVRDAWLARHPGVTLDPLSLSDLGVSAFRGKHRTDDKAALKRFLDAVESGRVKAGSFLIVESLDRLTREELGDAVELVLGLVNRGVRIVQLSPTEAIFDKPVNMTSLVLAVVELSRGRGESQRKSDLIAPAWARKRVAARESGKAMTRGCKAWLEIRGGKYAFKPGAKELIRRIFAMATTGHGSRGIAQALNREGVPTWGGTQARWYEVYVRQLLRGREVLGEFQPCRFPTEAEREKGKGEGKKLPRRMPDGPLLPEYFPAAVSEAEWLAAQAAAKARDNRGGRPPVRGDRVNVFQGLLHESRTGTRVHVMTRKGHPVLLPEGFKRHGDPGVSFPLVVFERAVLSVLREVNPRDVADRDGGPDEVAELSAKVTRLDSVIKGMVDQFDDGDVIPEVAAKLRAKNSERKGAVEALDRAKAKAASPLSATWGECRGLIEALDGAEGSGPEGVRDIRVRLRQAVGRVVESIHCLFETRGRDRLCMFQAWFSGGQRFRIGAIQFRPAPPNPRVKQRGRWWCSSWRYKPLDAKGVGRTRDLRNPAEVESHLKALLSYNPADEPEDHPQVLTGEI